MSRRKQARPRHLDDDADPSSSTTTESDYGKINKYLYNFKDKYL